MFEDLKNKSIQRGSALLQAMMAVVISSSVALIVSQYMSEEQKEIKRIEARIAINSIHNSIINTIADQASCSISLRAKHASFSSFVDNEQLDLIKRCTKTEVSDIDNPVDGINEITCESGKAIDLFKVNGLYANNSISIKEILYRNDTVGGGPRLEITYLIEGTSNTYLAKGISKDEADRVSVAGSSTIKKEPLLLTISDNESGHLTCQVNLPSTMNVAIEQSCQGNNAFLDKSGVNWKCYHELDLPECPAGSAIVAVVGGESHQNVSAYSPYTLNADNTETPSNANSQRKTGTTSPSGINKHAVTFRCLDISPVGSDCDDGDTSTLDLTVIKDEQGSNLLTEFFKYECVNISNCYDNTNSGVMYDSGFKYLTYNQTNKQFECIKKQCSSGEISITTQYGEQCISCPAGSVIVKIDASPGVMCSTSSCNDGTSGTNPLAPDSSAQQYSTGKWDGTGSHICRDLVTTDDYCKDGGKLKVNSDGSIGWNCCPNCDSSFDSERAAVCFGQSFTTSNGCTQCSGTKSLQSGCPNPLMFCPGTDMGVSDCGVACNAATGGGVSCCASCDSSFDSERAAVCLGQTFTASNGCTQCTGTMALNTGCDDPANYCSNVALPNSSCGTSCGNGSQPVVQGSLSAWSAWSTCEPSTGDSTGSTRTRTCEGSSCGGNCNNPSPWQLEEYQNCMIYDIDQDGGQFTFSGCKSDGGIIHYVSKSSGESCNNDSTAKAAYMNSTNPDCVPLCFFPITNQGTFRYGGSAEAYTGSGCSYTEFQMYGSPASAFADCPTGWTRYRNFSSALQVNCSCCNSKQGSCSTPNNCNSATSPAGWAYKDMTDGNYAIAIMFSLGQDKHATKTGKNCNTTSTNFACHNYIFQVGCAK